MFSGSVLCKDGFNVMSESNKFVVSKHGQFVGKGYDCRGLFRFSLAEICNKSVNHICGNVSDDARVFGIHVWFHVSAFQHVFNSEFHNCQRF